MRKIASAMLSIMSAIMLGGCIFGGSETTDIYTLPPAKNVCPANTSVTIVGFQDSSGTGQNMIYKTSEYRVVKDNYNRWQQYPSELLTSYARQAFASKGKNPNNYMVQGNFNSFIINLAKKELSFQVTYTIAEADTQLNPPQFSNIYEVSFNKPEPAEFANAFNNAAKQFMADLSNQIAAKNIAKK